MQKTSRRAAVLPLGIKRRTRTELPALVALGAIGEPWFAESHRTDLLAVALVVAELALPESLEAESAAALASLCSRPVQLEDKPAIAFALADCLPWLQLQPNHRVARAIAAVAARHVSQAA